MESIKRFWNDEDGQGMAEYALIIALIAVLLIAALGVLGGAIGGVFRETGDKMNSATGAKTY